MLHRLTPTILLAALAACSISEAKVPSEIDVQLASVTLADDCGGGALPTPPPTGGNYAKPPPQHTVARGSCAKPPCSAPARRCNQTSMQLAIHAQPATKATTIAITKVELLDEKGAVVQTLTASAPVVWQTDKYVKWDQAIAANDIINASYTLSSPDWNKVGGRAAATTKTFQLRVTYTVGNSARTMSKQAITPARIEPQVVT